MTLNDISQNIANNITPQINPTITLELLDNKNVIKVEFAGNQKPYAVKGKYFIRQADEDRVISIEKLKKTQTVSIFLVICYNFRRSLYGNTRTL